MARLTLGFFDRVAVGLALRCVAGQELLDSMVTLRNVRLPLELFIRDSCCLSFTSVLATQSQRRGLMPSTRAQDTYA